LVEALAAYAHEAWSGWMRYLFSKGRSRPTMAGMAVTIPGEWAERWMRQMNTPYAELRYDEQDSDRKEARRMLAIVAAARSALPPPPDVSATVSEIRDGEANDGALLSTDLFIEGRGMSVLVNATIHGEVTFTVSVDGVRRKSGTLRAALPRAPEPDLLKKWEEELAILDERFGPHGSHSYNKGASDYLSKCIAELRAARAGAEAPPPEEP
jgi:hypothetical protein